MHTSPVVPHLQTPLTQLAPVPQTLPHPPQFSGSVARSASQPSALCPLQSEAPRSHVYWQSVPEQDPKAYPAPDSVQISPLPPHRHVELPQVAPPAHATPHEPQFPGLLDVDTSQPFVGLPSQLA